MKRVQCEKGWGGVERKAGKKRTNRRKEKGAGEREIKTHREKIFRNCLFLARLAGIMTRRLNKIGCEDSVKVRKRGTRERVIIQYLLLLALSQDAVDMVTRVDNLVAHSLSNGSSCLDEAALVPSIHTPRLHNHYHSRDVVTGVGSLYWIINPQRQVQAQSSELLFWSSTKVTCEFLQ